MTTDGSGSEAPIEGSQQEGAPPAETGEKTAGDHRDEMIPKARLDKALSELRELKAFKTEVDAAKQKAADEDARKRGEIEKAQAERDRFKTQAEQWAEYAAAKLEGAVAAFKDSQRELYDSLVDDDMPLLKRLAVAEKLASHSTTESEPKPAGFGSSGGKGASPGGLIPATVTSRAEYVSWLANLNLSQDGMALLRDKAKMAAIRHEAEKRKLR